MSRTMFSGVSVGGAYDDHGTGVGTVRVIMCTPTAAPAASSTTSTA